MTKQFQSKNGFTLLEILIATTIFALSIFALVQTRSNSLRNMVESETLHEAVQLAASKTAEMEIKFQKALNKGGVTGSIGEESGSFPAPFEKYSWKASFKESTVQFTPGTVTKFLMDMGLEKETAEAQVEQQALILTNLNQAIKKNIGELTVIVTWEQFGRKMQMPVVTHLLPAKPLVSIMTAAE